MRNLVTRFENIGDTPRRGQIVGYHNKPAAIFRDKATQVEINGLKSEDRKNVQFNGSEYESKFTIGFEIEKTELHRSAVREYPLFCGFETDSSCGYEAVTHVLPLVGRSMWRTKVFNMFAEAKHIIEDEFSPSNSRCGGHITVAVKGMYGETLRRTLAPYSHILYAIFRHRLSNYYCKGNIRMQDMLREDKYVVCKNTGFGVEFRLPSRVQSVKQMMRRYELMYVMLDFAINRADAPISSFHNAVKPILMSMYNQDAEKVAKIMGLAKEFRKFLAGGKINLKTLVYFNGLRKPSTSRDRRDWDELEREYARGMQVNREVLDRIVAESF
jgi:hypothetical protein